uniref:Uncharacterized protein n=1 Tax=Timema bartmani TaxID=61472 RepID=A0A7R9EVK2_9NEOP|nr:unnamed protein product [Timema bartmani]
MTSCTSSWFQGHDLFLSQLVLSSRQTGARYESSGLRQCDDVIGKLIPGGRVARVKVTIYSCLDLSCRAAKLAPNGWTSAAVDKYLELVQYVDTRWSSKYLMLKRLIEMQGTLNVELASRDNTSDLGMLTAQDWRHICQNSGSASLVSYLLADLKQLPPSCWKTLVRLFKRKLELLVSMLFTLISTKRDINPGAKSNLQKYISEAMNLNEADIFIVLAAAEKVKPGTYSYVIEEGSLPSGEASHEELDKETSPLSDEGELRRSSRPLYCERNALDHAAIEVAWVLYVVLVDLQDAFTTSLMLLLAKLGGCMTSSLQTNQCPSHPSVPASDYTCYQVVRVCTDSIELNKKLVHIIMGMRRRTSMPREFANDK